MGTDILLNFDAGLADISIQDNDILQDNNLYSAVLISLFTDKRANNADELPIEFRVGTDYADLRGFFGDELYGESIGSKLWLLKREKQLPKVLVLAKQYAEESLQWLIRDSFAKSIHVEAINPHTDILQLKVHIELHKEQNALYSQEEVNWNFHLNLGV